MEPAVSKLGLLLLVLVVLRCGAGAAFPAGTPDDPHSLLYELNITSNNKPRCMGQGRMDRMNLLLYDCDNDEVKGVSHMLNGTETLAHMTQKLKDMGDLMREKLPDITPENYTERASSTLQVRLMCRCDANESHSGSLELGFNGQTFLDFDPKNGEYKADNPRGELMKEKCKNDEEVTKCFQVFLNGDCQKWLKFLRPKKKALETTAAPATTTTTVPAPSKAMNSQNNNIAWIIPLIIFILLAFFLLACAVWCIRNKRGRGRGAPETGSTSTCVPSWWPPFLCLKRLTRDPQELHPLQQMGRPAEGPDGPAPVVVTSSAL